MPRLFAFSLRLDKFVDLVDILDRDSGSFWSISGRVLLTGILIFFFIETIFEDSSSPEAL